MFRYADASRKAPCPAGGSLLAGCRREYGRWPAGGGIVTCSLAGGGT